MEPNVDGSPGTFATAETPATTPATKPSNRYPVMLMLMEGRKKKIRLSLSGRPAVILLYSLFNLSNFFPTFREAQS